MKKFYANGGRHPWIGRKHTEETKKKIREARARQVITKEHRRKISEGNKGRKH